MKQILITFAILTLVLTACGPTPEPTMSPADVQGTAMAAAMTMVAETQAAIPTATPIPPTEIPSATPFPTNTVPPLSLASPTQAINALALPTNTPVPASGSNDPCNQTLTTWDGESAKIRVVNATKPQGTIVLSIWVNTTMGQCGYIPANSNSFYIPMGTFSAGAFVTGKKDFKVFGGDVINRTGNYSLWITNDAILLKAGCAPDC
jgi:hypothetical protein